MPNCGGSGVVPPTPTFFATAALDYGIVAGIIGVIKVFNDAATGTQAALSSNIFANIASALGLSVNGLTALLAIVSVAAVTAALIIQWAWQSYSALCGPPPLGKNACVSGVVNAVQAGFTYWYSEVVGFQNNQPRADVVIRSRYWPYTELNNAPMVWCATCENCPPSVAGPSVGGSPGCSPIMPCYYHNAQVCSAAKGAAIGATIGAVVAAIGSVIAAIAIMAAAACSLTVAFAPICWAILLAILGGIILTVALVAAIGSAIGTQIGKAVAGGTSTPTTSGGSAIAAGAFVTIVGNLVSHAQSLGANAIWFAGWIPNANGTVNDLTASNGNGTMVLGMAVGKAPPFCYTDLEADFPVGMDICPLPTPPSP